MSRHFAFVQLDVPGDVGPPPGRYVLRHHAGADADHVLVVGRLDGRAAWAPPLKRRERRPQPADPEPAPPSVPATRLTVIRATPLDSEPDERWLQREAERSDGEVDIALAIVDRAIHAWRSASGEPHGQPLRRRDAVALRVGYGLGEQVAEGRWEAALSLPAAHAAPDEHGGRKSRRSDVLRPQERLSAILSARDAVLAAETLAWRARADLDAGRTREAALQLHLALEAALAELAAWQEVAGMAKRIAELDTLRDGVAEAANAALQAGLDPAALETVEKALGRVEAALKTRAMNAQF